MRALHELFLDAVRDERGGSRGRILGAGSSPAMGRLLQAQMTLKTDVDVVNYALTLEHLEAAFYKLASQYTFENDPFGNAVANRLTEIGGHEDAHVTALTKVVNDLGGKPVSAATYNFGVTDAKSFLATAMTLENIGVAAYDGAGARIKSADILTAAGQIVAVEARHASYLNLVNGTVPFPAAFETPMTPAEVLQKAGPFITSNGTPAS